MKNILLIVSVLAVIALAVLNLTYDFGIKPDVICSMANMNIELDYYPIAKTPAFQPGR